MEQSFLASDTKRQLIHTAFTFLPAMRYFHVHRKVLLRGQMFRKTSYYDPKTANSFGTSNMNQTHHLKELTVRLCFGYLAGWLVSSYMYGAKKKKLEVSEEMAEAIEDEGSLQYVVYNKKHRSGLAKMKRDWLYPGKIVDDEE